MTAARDGWLIVEDEMLIATLIEDAVVEMELKPIGPVPNVAAALKTIDETPPTGALLDVNLSGEPVYPVAEALASRNIPFVFITGYGAGGIRKEFADRPVLQKPFGIEQIQDAIRQVREAQAAAAASARAATSAA